MSKRVPNPSHGSTDDLIAVLQTIWNMPEPEKKSKVGEFISDAVVPKEIKKEIDNVVPREADLRKVVVEYKDDETSMVEYELDEIKQVLRQGAAEASVTEIGNPFIEPDIQSSSSSFDLQKVIVESHEKGIPKAGLVYSVVEIDSSKVWCPSCVCQSDMSILCTLAALIPSQSGCMIYVREILHNDGFRERSMILDVQHRVYERLVFELPPSKPPDFFVVYLMFGVWMANLTFMLQKNHGSPTEVGAEEIGAKLVSISGKLGLFGCAPKVFEKMSTRKVNEQSLSGSPAKLHFYTALRKPRERSMTLGLSIGVHPSHDLQTITKISAISIIFETILYKLYANFRVDPALLKPHESIQVPSISADRGVKAADPGLQLMESLENHLSEAASMTSFDMSAMGCYLGISSMESSHKPANPSSLNIVNKNSVMESLSFTSHHESPSDRPVQEVVSSLNSFDMKKGIMGGESAVVALDDMKMDRYGAAVFGVSLKLIFIYLEKCILTVCQNASEDKLTAFATCCILPPKKPPDGVILYAQGSSEKRRRRGSLEASQIDAWMEYSCVLTSGSEFDNAYGCLVNYLSQRTLFVRYSIYIAEIAIWGGLAGAGQRWESLRKSKKFPNFVRWYNSISLEYGSVLQDVTSLVVQKASGKVPTKSKQNDPNGSAIGENVAKGNTTNREFEIKVDLHDAEIRKAKESNEFANKYHEDMMTNGCFVSSGTNSLFCANRTMKKRRNKTWILLMFEIAMIILLLITGWVLVRGTSNKLTSIFGYGATNRKSCLLESLDSLFCALTRHLVLPTGENGVISKKRPCCVI